LNEELFSSISASYRPQSRGLIMTMPLGSLHHPFSDIVADIDGTSVRTRLAASTSAGGTAGRRGFVDVHTSTTSSPAAQASDEKLPLRGFDAADQPGSSSFTASRRRSQRHRPESSRTAADMSQSAAITESPRGSSHSGPTTLHYTDIPAPPRPLCVIDCCWCCAGSILISWLKVYHTLCLFMPRPLPIGAA